jgi:hypothetical protein
MGEGVYLLQPTRLAVEELPGAIGRVYPFAGTLMSNHRIQDQERCGSPYIVVMG